jgi:hypothetical protein
MLKDVELPLLHPPFYVDKEGLHITLPDGKVELISKVHLNLQYGERIDDVKITVMQQINRREEVYYAIHNLHIKVVKESLDELWIRNMLTHLHKASRLEKLVVKTKWGKHRSRASSSGNSVMRPR